MGLRRRRRSPTATRCCRFPTPSTSRSSYPDRQVITRRPTERRCGWRSASEGIIPCNAAVAEGRGADRRRLHRGGARPVHASSASSARRCPSYDRQVGATQEGRQYYANRWNIWQETIQKGARRRRRWSARTATPVASRSRQRKTRTITYYMNPEFPDDQTAARHGAPDRRRLEPGDEGDRRRARHLTPASADADSMMDAEARAATLPDIFVLKENDCNLANVKAFVTANPDVRDMVEARDNGPRASTSTTWTRPICSRPAPRWRSSPRSGRTATPTSRSSPGSATATCATRSCTGSIGRRRRGRSATGRRRQDPETGEIISASAYIYGAALDIYAKFADRQRAAGERPAQHRRPAVGQDDQRRARGERARPARRTRPMPMSDAAKRPDPGAR